ncbi:beclin 1-associated autophagy-related key regulator isoform X1 [Hydra vulgaris]|uniref:Beclin 1-associated autophagy-related key regulator n=1 Tax=Hydra vulgaris TaxID=6087 RepID=T2MBM0_HYDVU|nr:beclin 1-associated autophagy-related key regulator [Hydra vulgaris]
MSNLLLVAVEICNLCGRSSKRFTCQACISNGNFTNKSCSDATSYAAKRKRLKVVVAVQQDSISRLNGYLINSIKEKNKRSEIVHIQNHVESLKKIISHKKILVQNDKENNEKLKNHLSEQKKQFNKLLLKIEELRKGVQFQNRKQKLQRYKEKLEKKEGDLKSLRIFNIQCLIRDIFTLSVREVYPQFGTPPRSTYVTQRDCLDVVSQNMSSSAEIELEEATRTVHIGGQWISQDCSQREHTIVGVGMPSTEDFMKYYEWLKSYRNEPRSAECQTPLHDLLVLCIPASLLYTAQLTDVIAFYLGINLPNKIDYNNFSLLQVSRFRLYETVNKLSQNILQLCFSQRIPIDDLQPDFLLSNIKLCVSSDSLGCNGYFETFEFKFRECPFDSDSSAEELDYDSQSDTNDIEPEDWDQLTDLPDDHSIVRSESFSPTMDYSRDRSSSVSASGLMTSAAASVASALWSWKRQ